MTDVMPNEPVYAVLVLDEDSEQSIFHSFERQFVGENALAYATAQFEALSRTGEGLSVLLRQLVNGEWVTVHEVQFDSEGSPAKVEML